MIERCDYCSDDEYRQALAWQEEAEKEELAREEYARAEAEAEAALEGAKC